MFLKFLKDEKTYEISSVEFVSAEQVKILSADVPATKGGFDIINGEVVDSLYNQFTVPYDKENDYIIFTNDEKIYYTFFVYDKDTNLVTSQVTSTQSGMDYAVLRFSGQGKEYVNPAQETLFDEDGFNIYKVVDGKVVNTTAEEKAAYMKEKELKEYEAALESKLAELSAACNAKIIAGIDFGDKHFSYDDNDQKNLSNAVQLAMATNLGVPYHADGESCEVYSRDDIVAIYVAEETNLTQNITYHNQLKLYTQTLGTKAEVEAIKYGETELVGTYKETYEAMMAQADEVIRKFIGEN